LSADDFNNGEYKEAPINMNQRGATMTDPSMEPVFTTPDVMKEAHIGFSVITNRRQDCKCCANRCWARNALIERSGLISNVGLSSIRNPMTFSGP
jgi:hypothetical protein